ncbi:hypothetical protein VHEMI04900 [[Torrubiella] hemipterigena]|uniref:Sm domain-containing protein n=1 Tax=[Torrubiella] hemipterigena TaxID=1531966 RepID=A0A0A1SWH8_9HYPO|nr:hypothetical protein VHEMI04900 [[Torrubiella] hemipterigena]
MEPLQSRASSQPSATTVNLEQRCSRLTVRKMNTEEARDYLSSIINKNLRVTTTDGRLFWGELKCTDPEQNIVLSHTYEYRPPSDRQRAEAMAKVAGDESVTLDMTSRYVGLVVVPGKYVVKIEVEKFSSQLSQEERTMYLQQGQTGVK